MNVIFTAWHSNVIEEILTLNTLILNLAQEIRSFDTKTLNILHVKSVAALLPDNQRPAVIKLNYSPYQQLALSEQLLKNYINTLNYVFSTPNFKPNELALKSLNMRLLTQLKPSWEAKPISAIQTAPSSFLDKYVHDLQGKLHGLDLPIVYRYIKQLIWLYNLLDILQTPRFIHLNTYMALLITLFNFKEATQLDLYSTKTFWNIYPDFLEHINNTPLPKEPTSTTIFFLRIINSLAQRNLDKLRQYHKPILLALAKLNKRQKKLLRLLCRSSSVRIKEIQKRLRVSHMTVYRDLNKLNSLGLITITQRHKRKHYVPSPIACGQMDL